MTMHCTVFCVIARAPVPYLIGIHSSLLAVRSICDLSYLLSWHFSLLLQSSTLQCSVQSRVYVTVGCPSIYTFVYMSRRSTAAVACGWFAAEHGFPAADLSQQQSAFGTESLSQQVLDS